jgi:hypothetical protein
VVGLIERGIRIPGALPESVGTLSFPLSVVRMNGIAGVVIYRRFWAMLIDVMPPGAGALGGVFEWSRL